MEKFNEKQKKLFISTYSLTIYLNEWRSLLCLRSQKQTSPEHQNDAIKYFPNGTVLSTLRFFAMGVLTQCWW